MSTTVTVETYDRPKSKWKIWIAWSAFVQSLVSFLIFLLLSVFWFLLFDFAIENAFPNLFPIADYGLSLVVLFIGFLLPLSTSAVGTRFNRYPETMVQVMRSSRTLAAIVYNLQKRGQLTQTVLETLHPIIRAIPSATRDQFTDQGEGYGESYGDINYVSLPSINEVRKRYAFERRNKTILIADALLSLIYDNTPKLAETTDLYYRIEETRIAIANVEAVKRTGVLPAVMGFILVVVWIFAFTAPWLLWGIYRWWGILFMFITVWPALAAAEISRGLANPFVRSALTWHDIDNAILDNALYIDKLMLNEASSRAFLKVVSVD